MPGFVTNLVANRVERMGDAAAAAPSGRAVPGFPTPELVRKISPYESRNHRSQPEQATRHRIVSQFRLHLFSGVAGSRGGATGVVEQRAGIVTGGVQRC